MHRIRIFGRIDVIKCCIRNILDISRDISRGAPTTTNSLKWSDARKRSSELWRCWNLDRTIGILESLYSPDAPQRTQRSRLHASVFAPHDSSPILRHRQMGRGNAFHSSVRHPVRLRTGRRSRRRHLLRFQETNDRRSFSKTKRRRNTKKPVEREGRIRGISKAKRRPKNTTWTRTTRNPKSSRTSFWKTPTVRDGKASKK